MPYHIVEKFAKSNNISIQYTTVDPEEEPLPNDEMTTLKPRRPVLVVMGQIDHGKTTLCDTLRGSSIAEKEIGKITQKIYAVNYDEDIHHFTLLDTPGHPHFFRMRDNSSSMADGVILVIAANEGIVSNQTKDIFQYITEYKLPCIVALNKMDLALPNIKEYIRSQLYQYNLKNIPIVETCALLKPTLKPLLNEIEKMIKYRIKPLGYFNGLAEGTVLESYYSKGMGIVLRVLIRRGTLNLDDTFICGYRTGKIKQIVNMDNNNVEIAVPGDVVDVGGLKRPDKSLRSSIPPLGDTLFCRPKSIVDEILEQRLLELEFDGRIVNEENVEGDSSNNNNNNEMNVNGMESDIKSCVVKADTTASLASLVDNLQKCDVNVVKAGIGEVRTSDITYALQTNSTILALDVKIPKNIMTTAKRSHVKIMQSRIAHYLIEEFTGVKVYHSNDVRKT